MALEDVPGQARIAALLGAAVEGGRLAHAYLFVGPGGVGRLAMARELAAALLCSSEGAARCDACKNCRSFRSGNHPDYHEVGVPEGKQVLPIAVVRQMEHDAHVKPVLALKRVFVVKDAEKMNLEAANCFLKTLEEPPGDSCFILVAAGLWHMPKTVISRCQVVKFSGLPAQDVEQALLSGEVDADDAWWLARRSWGSPGRALAFRDTGLHSINRELVEELFELRPEDVYRLSDWLCERADEMAGSRAEARAVLQELLECVAIFYRDLMAVTFASGAAELFNRASDDRFRELASQSSGDTLLECADRVFEAIERVGANANRQVVLDNMLAGVSRQTG